MTYKFLSDDSQDIDNPKSFSNLGNRNSDIVPITDSSDISQTVRELNEDVIDKDKFSSIDMKTRLGSIEISSIIAVDVLVALGVLPTETGFITRSKKRLNVSLRGLGRGEVVRIANGMDENSKNKSFADRVGSFFVGNKG